MRIPRIVGLAACVLSSAAAEAQSGTTSPLADRDRVRLAEARRLIAAVADSVWPGWSAAPAALLLVTSDREFLLWHPRPSSDFERVGHDSLLATVVHVRPRRFSPTLLATFPAVGGVPTIVIGTAEQTGKRSTAWVLTIAHEHFHQWQYSHPEYYSRVAALDLAGGDTTGMWMLEYPFPYASPPVRAPFDALSGALRTGLRDSSRAGAERHSAAIADARRRLHAALAEPDRRYLDFQLWQEGIARYTEYVVARFAAAHHRQSAEFEALSDAEPYGVAADRLWRGIAETESVSLTNQRSAFYPVGAGLALWLDRDDPAWRKRYFERMLTLEPLPPR